jgi:multisubunit Na+/H+ antiporter MnhC subunit
MIAHIAMAAGFALILIGIYGALTNRNLMRMIVSFTIAEAGVHTVLVSIGYMSGRTAPIIDDAVPAAEVVARIIDPLPQALVLTAIVIGVGITALMLAYAYKLFEKKRSLDIGKFTELKW